MARFFSSPARRRGGRPSRFHPFQAPSPPRPASPLAVHDCARRRAPAPDAARGSRTESGAFHFHFRAVIGMYSPACQRAASHPDRIIPSRLLPHFEKIFFSYRSCLPPELPIDAKHISFWKGREHPCRVMSRGENVAGITSSPV